MIKLLDILNELQINNPNGIKATKKDNPYVSSKSHIVKIDDKTEFTIHKHKNYYNLYPSFKHNSIKYAKIKAYLISRHIKFQEVQNNGAGVVNLRIPLNQIRI